MRDGIGRTLRPKIDPSKREAPVRRMRAAPLRMSRDGNVGASQARSGDRHERQDEIAGDGEDSGAALAVGAGAGVLARRAAGTSFSPALVTRNW